MKLSDLKWEKWADDKHQHRAQIDENHRIYKSVNQDGVVTYSIVTPYANPTTRGLKDYFMLDPVDAQCIVLQLTDDGKAFEVGNDE